MSSDVAEIAPEGLSDLLARIVVKQEIRDGIAAQLKSVEKELESLESLASEQLGASGLDGCRVAGKTWWIDEALYVSAPKENREKIIEAAEGEGLQDAVSVNTTTIKSWLCERAKRLDTGLDDAAVGTKFEGLISQFVKVRLRSRASG
jgi:hypothetical protein